LSYEVGGQLALYATAVSKLLCGVNITYKI